MILKKNIVFGLALCILIFSLVVPFLFGLRDVPGAVMGGEGIVIITQKDSSHTLNASLVDSLAQSENVSALSGEVIVPTVVGSEPIICKGVDSKDVLEIDGLELRGSWLDINTAVVGEEAASRLDVDIGSVLTVASPNLPTFCQVTVSGVYFSEKPDDGIFMSVDYARFLIGLSDDSYTVIRALTDNPLEVQNIVESDGSGVTNIVIGDPVDETPGGGGGGGSGGSSNETSPNEIVLIEKQFDFFSANNNDGGYTSKAMQYGQETVDVAVISMGVMTAMLVTVGVLVLILRGIAEGRNDVGVLVAIGTPKSTIRVFFLKDIAFLIALAAPIGILGGIALSNVLGAIYPLTAFGQTIRPVFTSAAFLFLIVGSLCIPLLAWLIGGEGTIGEHPKTLFTSIEVDTPSTSLTKALEEEE